MTTLQEVTVDGLAGRSESIHFTLKRDVNIFFGLNGSGKTSLLKILNAGLSDEASSIARVPFTAAQVVFYSLNKNKTIKRSIGPGDKKSNEKAVDRQYRIAVQRSLELQDPSISSRVVDELMRQRFKVGEWKSIPAEETGSFRHEYLSTNRMIDNLNLARRASFNPLTDAELDTIFAEQIVEIWQAYTNRVLTAITEIQSDGLREILQSLLFVAPESIEQSAPEVKKAYERAAHFLQRPPARRNSTEYREFQRRFNEEPHFRGVVEDIDRIERRIEQAEEPRRRLAELASAFFTADKSLRFTNSGIRAEVRGEEIPLASLSSGEKQLVRILVQVIRAEENVIIIDEPELSMHIDWQRNLIGAIRTVNPGVQIVMATHSPDIMENVPDECIFKL